MSDSKLETQSLEATSPKKSWLSKLPWWIPQKRYVFETQEEIDEGYRLRIKKSANKEEQLYQVREYKDEANRKWYHFFNEFEYRYTTEELNKHDWWRWFDKGTSSEEKKLITKLDILITFVAFLGYWSKSLSQSNLNNAYVSGMKEDIGMKGNDLIDTQVLFSAANIIFELPFIFTLPRINPTYMLFGAELFWSVFTLTLSTVKNPAALKGMRFLVGAGEGLFFPMYHYIFANFYKPTEIQRRTGTYYFGLYLGTLTSGLLQSAIFNALDGVNNISGWRYMFLIDGVIAFTITLITLFCVPGTPFKCYSIWLTDDEIKLARKRMRENGTDEKPPTTKQFFDPKVYKTIFGSWIFWIFTLSNIGGFNSNSEW
ncbi:putative transporter SEO1 [Wickerhamomyces ciferrii]|uniref:Transporter SEO1 n=1 Tax=Wickerhamomyces ciferrii (strain ATCC 14091 / BCRC 22168 / CBS 111 / JCM 3599 / NBRC 0793 / NRRL Y-1031 F-60-10) TaxID=1206466 RepID=K0KG86_WICCF|nr:putative transporter SEO1 [Wickerhamomyces ciferrii]CCH44170.1 putative transporter SEO1 [Wickerhamomyces ciferrii]